MFIRPIIKALRQKSGGLLHKFKAKQTFYISLMALSFSALFFQNCSNVQSGLAIKIVEGAGLGVYLSTPSAPDIDDTVTSIPVRAEFLDDVTGFTAASIQVENGSVENFSGSGKIYDFFIKPTAAGKIRVTVPKSACEKMNSSIPCGQSNTLTFNSGDVAATVTLEQIVPSAKVSDSFQVKVKLSKAITIPGNWDSNFSLTNATLSNVYLDTSDSCNCVFVMTVNPIIPANVSNLSTFTENLKIKFLANKIFNKWGRGNVESNLIDVNFESSAPQVQLVSLTSSDKVNGDFDLQLTSSVKIGQALTESNFSVGGGSILSILPLVDSFGNSDPFRMNIKVRPVSDIITIQLKEGAITNVMGIGSPASTIITKSYENAGFKILDPLTSDRVLASINDANKSSYSISGACIYSNRPVDLYISSTAIGATKTKVGTTTCQMDLKFSLTANFGTPSVGTYNVTLESSDPSNTIMTRVYTASVIKTVILSPDSTPDSILFQPQITSGQKVLSNQVAISGLEAQAVVNVSFNNPIGTTGISVYRNGTKIVSEQAVAPVQNGDIVELNFTPTSFSHGTTVTETVRLGTIEVPWKISMVSAQSVGLIFVSSSQFNGSGQNLTAPNADLKCSQIAANSGFTTGNWKAVVADGVRNLENRIPANWAVLKRMDGVIVANSLNDFVSGNLKAPINIDETGSLRPNALVLTGFAANGAIGNKNNFCAANQGDAPWTAWQQTGSGGYNFATDSRWYFSENNGSVCSYNSSLSIYCMSDNVSESQLTVDPIGVAFKRGVTLMPGELMTSNSVQLLGFTKLETPVSLGSGISDLKLKIDGVIINSNTAQVRLGSRIELLMAAPTVVGTEKEAQITIGSKTYSWKVGLADSSITRRIFVSEETYGKGGGVAGADQHCQSSAANAGFTQGSWIALASSTTDSAANRIPWNWGKLTLISGTTIANNWNELWSGNLQNPINMTANSRTLTGQVWVATGTNPGGRSNSLNQALICNNWSDFWNSRVNYGSANSKTSSWIDNMISGCSTDSKLYCVENDLAGEDAKIDPVSFSPLYFQNAGERVLSNIAILSGFTSTMTIQVSSAGDIGHPKMQISTDGTVWGAEVSSGTVRSGNRVRLVMDVPAAPSASKTVQKNKATFQIGNSSYNWYVYSKNPSATPKRIFVTSTVQTCALGGYTGADQLCKSLADAAHPNSEWQSFTWKAVLSGAQTDEANWAVNTIGYNWSYLCTVDQFDSNGNCPISSASILPSQMWTNALQSPININESGQILPSNSTTKAWTNTNWDGRTPTTDPGIKDVCQNWTSDRVDWNHVAVGDSNSGTGNWLNNEIVTAGNNQYPASRPLFRVYCVQQ